MLDYIEQLGGGPLAVAVVFMSLLIWKLLNWWRESQDKRIEDANSHSLVLREVQKESMEAMHSVTSAVKELTREVTRNV